MSVNSSPAVVVAEWRAFRETGW